MLLPWGSPPVNLGSLDLRYLKLTGGVMSGAIAFTGDAVLKLGDKAGSYALKVKDSDENNLFQLDSHGNITYDGTAGATIAFNVNTTSTTPAFVINKSGAGTGAIFIVNDSGSGDTSPFVILGNGNIGIGTTGPGALLSLGSAAGAQKLQLYESGNVRGGFGIPGDGSVRSYIWSGAPVGFTWGTVSSSDGTTFSELMRMTSSGNVGIGTTGPGSILHISSNQSGKTTLGDSRQFRLQNTNGAVGERLEIGLGYGSAYQPVVLGHVVTDASGSTKGDFYIATRDNTNNAAPTERLYIQSSGNVGIGTTSPTNLLSFGGNSARILWLERNTVANTAGNNFLIQSGGATVGATDKNAGIITVAPGLTTGMGFASARFQRLTRAASTATADNSLIDAVIVPSVANLTNNSAVGLFTISLPTLGMAGGSIKYTITMTDGTDMQTYSGVANYSAVNKGGVYTTTITDLATADASALSSAATLAVTWTITTGTNIITINVNANSSLTPTVMKIYYTIHNGSAQAVAQL